MHITSEYTGMLGVWWHGHCNKAMLYLEKYHKSGLIRGIFEGGPAQVTQHHRNTIILGTILYKIMNLIYEKL